MDSFSSKDTLPLELDRLLICNQFYPPDFAATGQLLDELAQQLGQKGCKVRVFTSQPGYAFTDPSAPRREEQGSLTIRRTRVTRLWPQRIRGKVVSGLIYCLRASLHLIRPPLVYRLFKSLLWGQDYPSMNRSIPLSSAVRLGQPVAILARRFQHLWLQEPTPIQLL